MKLVSLLALAGCGRYRGVVGEQWRSVRAGEVSGRKKFMHNLEKFLMAIKVKKVVLSGTKTS